MPAQKPGTSKQDYATPENFIAAAKARLGIFEFDFDYAANKSNAKAARFWSSRDNSLAKTPLEWRAQLGTPGVWDPATQPLEVGAVMTVRSGWGWLNPPFKNIEPWVAHCVALMRAGGRVAFLVPASVGADWFRDHVDGKARVLFLNGRLAFMKNKPRDLYPKDCVLCLFSMDEIAGYEVWDWRGEVERRKAAA
jgi:phage N-6-adenine-methyltransferase